jgi:hypothetical protein
MALSAVYWIAALIAAYMFGLSASDPYLSEASEVAVAGAAVVQEFTDQARQAFWIGIAFALVAATITYGLLAGGYFALGWILRGFLRTR